MQYSRWCAAGLCAAALGCGSPLEREVREDESPGEAAAGLHRSADFAVSFADCVESIGVTLVGTETAAQWVPEPFVLAGAGTPVTPLVVRTAHCREVAIGRKGRPARVVQIGAVIVPPDGTGDIDNYTLWYFTDSAKLKGALQRAGLVVHEAPIEYDLRSEDEPPALTVRVGGRRKPLLRLEGSVAPAPGPAGSFLANWWSKKRDGGTLKLATSVPVIAIGGADLVLSTQSGSDLADLLGSDGTGFPILQQFNEFSDAEMQVSALE
jgi:hypothetical protein